MNDREPSGAGVTALIGGFFFLGGIFLGNYFAESIHHDHYNPFLYLLGMAMGVFGAITLIAALLLLVTNSKK